MIVSDLHTVDKSAMPTVNILGVEIAAIDMDWLLRFTDENVKRLSGDYIGVSKYLSFTTFSCFVGVFKPDPRIYLDALEKCGVPAEETVFIDDAVQNLDGAAALGITPVLIAVNPAADVETNHAKIRDLRELIR